MIRRHGAKFEAGGNKVLAAEQKKWAANQRGAMSNIGLSGNAYRKRSILGNLNIFENLFSSGRSEAESNIGLPQIICVTPPHIKDAKHLLLSSSIKKGHHQVVVCHSFSLFLNSSLNFSNVKDLV